MSVQEMKDRIVVLESSKVGIELADCSILDEIESLETKIHIAETKIKPIFVAPYL